MDIITSILCRYKDTIKAFNAPLNKTIKDNNGAAVQSGERGAFFGSEVQWEKALTLADKALAKAAEKQLAAEKRAKDKAERAKIREQKQAEREEKRKARLLQQAADMERKAAEKREEVARLNAPQTIDKDAQKDVNAA